MKARWESTAADEVKRRIRLLLPTENVVNYLIKEKEYNCLSHVFKKRSGSFDYYPPIGSINSTRVANGLPPLHTTQTPDDIDLREDEEGWFRKTIELKK